MNYLSRSVFTTDISHEDAPTARFQYDVNPIRLGFGGATFERTQKHVSQGWDVEVFLDGDQSIKDFEAFFDAIGGGLKGFWFPVPWESFSVIDGASSTTFDIENIGLEDTWDIGADQYLFFLGNDGSQYASKISGVVDVGGGVERVTIDDGLNIDETFSVYRLHFVTLSGGVESGRAAADGVRDVSFQLVEIPLEYEAASEGVTPCWLYEFSQDFKNGTVAKWRLTNFDIDLSDGVNSWISFNLTHRKIERSLESDREECEIEAAAGTAHPLSQFIPFRPDFPILIRIYEASFTAPGTAADAKIRFTGEVQKAQPSGAQITATAEGILSLLQRKFPRVMIGPRCQVSLYSPQCGVPRATYGKTGSLSFPGNANECRVTNATLVGTIENQYEGGYIDTGLTDQRELRMILSNSAASGNDVDFVLDRGFAKAIVSQDATVYPGCDGLPETCRDVYDNLVNHRGHPNIAQSNLSIEAIPAQNPKGNKK